MLEELKRLANETEEEYKIRLCVGKLNKEYDIDWTEIIEITNSEGSPDNLRKKAYGYREILEMQEKRVLDSGTGYKETTEILTNGVQRSDKLIKMSEEQSKDVNYLLKAHGFDVESWDLVSAKNNIWNVSSKTQGVQTLYSSKITTKPKVTKVEIENLLEILNAKIEPLVVNTTNAQGEGLLEIPMFDMHFGISTYNDYEETLHKILGKIKSKKWDNILFVIGQDLLHNDGFEGTTTSGTMIDKVDTEQAWEDAFKFYSVLITEAIKHSNTVNGIYSNGNHDKGISFGFVKTLEVKFPQVTWDSTMKQRKAYVYHDVFLGFTHGDKGKNRMEKNFYSEFGKEIAKSEIVEIHSGHIHHEVTKDNLGCIVRALATKAKTDGYHYDNGFIGAAKRFQLFEFTKNSLEATYYV